MVAARRYALARLNSGAGRTSVGVGNPVYGLAYARGKSDGVVETLAAVAQEVASAKISGRWQGAVGALGVFGMVGAAYGVMRFDPWSVATRTRNLLVSDQKSSV